MFTLAKYSNILSTSLENAVLWLAFIRFTNYVKESVLFSRHWPQGDDSSISRDIRFLEVHHEGFEVFLQQQ